MKKAVWKVRECGIVYVIGSLGYSMIEILWRGFTHWTMALTGGLCFLLLYHIDGRHPQEKLPAKCLRGACWITAIEFLVGCLVNLKLKWNLLGQVCPLYFALWFLLCIPVYTAVQKLRSIMQGFLPH